jgi:SAM-dependent methyltransferase
VDEALLTAAQRQDTLARFARHREAWSSNEALRTLYAEWYTALATWLPPRERGDWIELGSGPGFAREFIPGLKLTDVVRADWHDLEVDATRLSFPPASLGALVLFDVLHHLTDVRGFLGSASAALAPGGRIVLCEPYISPLSYPVYKLLHEEDLDLWVDPLDEARPSSARHPFEANQAIPTTLFGRHAARLEHLFPNLVLRHLQRICGLAYPLSGGFGHKPLLPVKLWRKYYELERRLPSWVTRWMAFRMIVVLEKTADGQLA